MNTRSPASRLAAQGQSSTSTTAVGSLTGGSSFSGVFMDGPTKTIMNESSETMRNYAGRFTLSMDILQEDPSSIHTVRFMQLMGIMAIVRAETDPVTGDIEYTACSPILFDRVEKGKITPNYRLTWKNSHWVAEREEVYIAKKRLGAEE